MSCLENYVNISYACTHCMHFSKFLYPTKMCIYVLQYNKISYHPIKYSLYYCKFKIMKLYQEKLLVLATIVTLIGCLQCASEKYHVEICGSQFVR